MSRRPLYNTADDLFARCTIQGDCIVWPLTRAPVAVLNPNSPMAQRFCTVSVPRILFCICRFPPAGHRLIRWCNTKNCVNPFHHAESTVLTNSRAKLDTPDKLLPTQTGSAHLTYPSPEEILMMRPTRKEYLRVLVRSARIAGFDGKGIPNRRTTYSITATLEHNPELKKLVRYAEPDKPLFALKPRDTGETSAVANNEPRPPHTINLDELADKMLPPVSSSPDPN